MSNIQTGAERMPHDLRSEERFSRNAETDLVCRLLLEKKKTNTMKGTKASDHTCGEPSQDAPARSGRNCLKKGTISLVEYSPLACIAIRSMATRMLARICRVSLLLPVSPRLRR